jgi:hypothetical protein
MKMSKLIQTEGKCSSCGGDGWYVEPDNKGEPQQVQCSACQGQGGEDDPEPRLRPSGEPMNEPFQESANMNETAGNPASYQSACAAVAKVVAQNMLSGVADSQVLNYDDVISIIYGIDQKKVMQQMDVLIKQKLDKLRQRQGINERGHIKLSEMLTQMEGEEEKLGGAAYDREDAWNKSQSQQWRKQLKGITFFNVKPGQESDAQRYGLTKFKNGSWGIKHVGSREQDSGIIRTIETKFGPGKYWQPKN